MQNSWTVKLRPVRKTPCRRNQSELANSLAGFACSLFFSLSVFELPVFGQSPSADRASLSTGTSNGLVQSKPPETATPAKSQPEQNAVEATASTKDGASGSAADGLAILATVERATIAAIEKAERSVVAIARIRKDQAPANRGDLIQIPPQIPGQFPLLDSPENSDFIPSEFASGVVISPDGLIVTCAHALDNPRLFDYYVWLDKRLYTARVVARPAKVLAADPYTDLAILKIDAQGLAPMVFGEAAQLRKGSFVICLGNPYAIARDGQASASWGIVANLQRAAPPRESSEAGPLAKESQHRFGTLIQTDARLNLGTSGGALINLHGEMIGLTTSLAALSGYEQAAGYAIATDDMFRRVLDALKIGQLPEFGFLGIQPDELRAHERNAGFSGARVSLVIPGLPGDVAGLRNDDCIAEINSKPIEDRNGLFRELSQLPAGAEVDLLVQRPRRGETLFSTLHLKATLSKKYISTSRPAFALVTPELWRGMLVEYTTAVPSELVRGGSMAQRRSGTKLAILSVDPDSSAWRAGIRAGHGLLSINGTRLSTPEEFYAQARKSEGVASLQVYRGTDRLETIQVSP